ncbi:MAG: ComEC/Rec2 family competence protein [Deltaproteobacteria bacterium]|nr:MAG: ComEC/Rec2 family competence protein [Deltaproteobacteria bacterium]
MEHSTLLGFGVWLGVLAAGGLTWEPLGWALAALALGGGWLVCRAGPLILGLGLTLGVLAVQISPPGPALRGPVAVHGWVVRAPVGATLDLELRRAGTPSEGLRPARGRVRLELEGSAPAPGSELIAWGEARAPTASVLPGAPDLGPGTRMGAVRSVVRARGSAVVGGRPGPYLPVPARHAGVLQSLALGDRRLLDARVTESLRRTGTSHLLAISGFHVGVVAGVVGGISALLLRSLGIAYQRGVSLALAWCAAAFGALVYALFAGAPVSAQRAVAVVMFAALIRCVGARPDPVPLVATIAALLLCFDPAAAVSPAFQLSFGAVIGLARLAPPLEGARPRWWPDSLRWIWTSLIVTIAATVGTLPAAGWWFQALPTTTPVANLVAVPITTFALAPLAVAAGFAPSPVDGWAYQLGDVVVDALLFCLDGLAAEPLPIALDTAGALALGSAVVLHRRWAWMLALALIFAPPPPAPSGLRITWPDVGQGAAALVEWPDGRRWLVDGGPRSEEVLHWLRRRKVHHLDVVVATHPRHDHAGGLAAVVRDLSVGEVWLPRWARGEPPLHDLVVTALDRGVRVVPGPAEDQGASARGGLDHPQDWGLVLLPSHAGHAVLLPSDLSAQGEERLLQELDLSSVVAVAAPRHGGRGASSRELIEAARPQVVIAQSGRHHRFAHPAAETVRRWSTAGARVYQTRLDGTVELTVHSGHLVVRTWRADRGWRTERTISLGEGPSGGREKDRRRAAVP